MNRRPIRILLAMTLLAFALLPAARAHGQEEVPTAVPREGDYAFLYHVTFRPGKSDEGTRILRQHLIPAWRRAGVDVTLLESLVGTRDAWLLVPLRDGPGTFEWVVSPQDAETWAALVERAGSAERANEIVDRFIGFVERQSQDFVFLSDGEGGGE